MEYFGGHVGRFLDIGANDGYTFSNTGQLAERGWSGVCVEPSPRAIPNLVEYHAIHPVDVVHAALGLHDGLIEFWDCQDALMSSADPRQAARFRHLEFRKIYACSITWPRLLSLFEGPYQFVNIDVEGLNADVALTAPLDELRAEVICIEDDLGEHRERVISRFSLCDYHHEKIGGNLLFYQ